MNSYEHPPRIAIVGAGYAGTMLAAHLLRHARPAHVDLIDTRIPGRGLAYSTVWDQHLLNVPAARMSAFGSLPSHFLDWLRLNGYPKAAPDSFLPRKVFGGYIQDILQNAVGHGSPKHRFRHYGSRASRVSFDGLSAKVHLENGDHVAADRVVLATGNPAPRKVDLATERYFNSPWESGALTGLCAESSVLLLGAGLTAVDAFLALEAQGFRGKVYCLSRRGKCSHVHTIYHVLAKPFVPPHPTTARRLLRTIRDQVKLAQSEGHDWRAVLDSLRPITNEIWSKFDVVEQNRILRHLKTWWDIHRHRMAPEIGSKIDHAVAEQRLSFMAGRLQSVTPRGNDLQLDIKLRSQEHTTLEVDRLINCSGSEADYRCLPDPLLRTLMDAGRIQSNANGKGLRTDQNGALIDHGGGISQWLFTLGPSRFGSLFETTAIPELRTQAEALANHLVAVPFVPIELSMELEFAAGI